MRTILSCSVAAVLVGHSIIATAAPAAVPDFPLAVDQSRSLTAQQQRKAVTHYRKLDGMESLEHWKSFGPGEMTLTGDRARDGSHSIRLTSPTKGTKPPGVQGRPFGESGIRREFTNEDWSAYNRISTWVYPDLPGFNVVSLLLKLHTEGTTGRSYTDGAMHFVLLRNHEWNHVMWEITHLDRTQVSGVDFIYRLQGNEPGATERVTYDFDELMLESVSPEHFRGWNVAAGQIAFCMAGYAPASPKLAFAVAGPENRFELLRANDKKHVWSGTARLEENAAGKFHVLDFTPYKRAGSYVLRIGNIVSTPFAIQEAPWRDPLIAALNFFYCERCGFAVKGIHEVCHRDWQVQHSGRTLPINGGWHDAGDLSQGLCNTSEAVWSMLRIADRIRKRDPELAARFLSEARWGAEWLLKTRFGDGYRVSWATMDFWTDGVPGNVDDVVVRAGKPPFENFLAAAAEAAAARAFQRSQPAFAKNCLTAAEADFDFAAAETRNPGVELASAGTQAAVKLYRVTKSEKYALKARAFAGILLQSQETARQPWELPLAGFFYASPRKDRILHYNHRSHEQGPVVALVDLCTVLPSAPEAKSWRECVKTYGEYLLAASRVTAPYHMCPAGIYRLADTSDPAQQKQIREGFPLAEGVYLRRFPVWSDFRGNLGVLLSQANAAAAAGRLLGSAELRQLASEQLEWTLGRNPFSQSLMYGVGYNYAPQYTAMSGDITGSLPVGIQSRLHEDVPYWPTSNCYNYAEIWVHPVSRFFATLAELEH